MPAWKRILRTLKAVMVMRPVRSTSVVTLTMMATSPKPRTEAIQATSDT